MSITETKILLELKNRGEVKSLFALATDTEMDYKTAHRAVKKLEARGLIRTQRRAGAAMTIRPAAGLANPTNTEMVIYNQLLTRGRIDSIRAMAQNLGIAERSAYNTIRALERAGLIVCQRGAGNKLTVLPRYS